MYLLSHYAALYFVNDNQTAEFYSYFVILPQACINGQNLKRSVIEWEIKDCFT